MNGFVPLFYWSCIDSINKIASAVVWNGDAAVNYKAKPTHRFIQITCITSRHLLVIYCASMYHDN